MISKESVIEKLKEVKDPEIGIDVWTLGLIYSINTDDDGIEIKMTLTTPFCPFADVIVRQVEQSAKELLEDKEIQSVRVDLTFEPPWKPTDEIRTMLGL
ncbi:MAG: metal-sulfur cluster assembly factor [Candidatus Pacebacteria bacterium]|nr:metal-sulfur cluster assembly factor [Candidatus Paceibacterota bacterium]